MSSSHDTLANRLAMILTKLNNGDSFTAKELAEEFDVNIRTIQKDLNERFIYLPIEKDGNRYFLPEYALGKFNAEDIKDFAAFSGIGELYPSLSDDLIVDILNKKVNDALYVRGHVYEDMQEKQKMFDQIGGAINSHYQLSFTYKEKQRFVSPYKLINTNGIWYLVAVENEIVKSFTFGKIEAFNVSDNSFVPDKEVLQRIEDKKSVWFGHTEIEVTLAIDAEVAEYFLRRELLPHQKIIEKSKESVLVTAKVAYEEEILSTVRYWIPHITIVTPEHLQEKLNASLQGYIQNTK